MMNATPSSGSVGQSADLRTRIVAVLRHEIPGLYPASAKTAADAVIRELGLNQEWGALDDEDSGFITDEGPDNLGAYPNETIKTRWITEWIPC